jgi:hypothetical protein
MPAFDWNHGCSGNEARYTWIQQAFGQLLQARIDRDKRLPVGTQAAPLCDVALIPGAGFGWPGDEPLPGMTVASPAPGAKGTIVLERGIPMRYLYGTQDRCDGARILKGYTVEAGLVAGTVVWFGNDGWAEIVASMLVASVDEPILHDAEAGERLLAHLRQIVLSARSLVLAGLLIPGQLEAEAAWAARPSGSHIR